MRELEEALHESIKITAEREIVVADQQMRLDRAEKDVSTTIICKIFFIILFIVKINGK